jgi:DNA-binding PadR family transcriptional regulator
VIITSDIDTDIIFDIESVDMRRHHKFRRRIGVPKGMLRHIALKIIEKQPMSGSEIVDRIQEYTDWRPSPGSIYPLLSQLQEEGLIEPHPDEDPSLKRFKLTEQGALVLEEHSHIDGQLRNRHRSIHRMYWILHREMPEDMYESFSTLLDTVEETFEKAKASPEASESFKGVLGEASRKLKDIGA